MFQGCILTPDAMIVNIDNKVYNVPSDHPNADRLREAYKNGDVDGFIEAFNVEDMIKTYLEGTDERKTGVTIVNDEIFYNGEPVHNSVVDAIQRMIAEGFDIQPMVKFLENLMQNPSFNSVKDLWRFMEAMGLTVTEDGCFLAYKSVRSDYRDKYTGRIDNTPGSKPERLPRNKVDDNPTHTCSHGYHVGALEYAGPNGWYHSCGDKVIICKVNPADVVSVPVDHNGQKLRCCYYEPVGEFTGELKASVYSGKVGDNYSAPAPEKTFVNFVNEEIDPDKLVEGETYTALYTDRKGKTKLRYFMVDEVDRNFYIVELMEPEEHYGEMRCFRVDGLSEVYAWDGVSFDEDDEDDYCSCGCDNNDPCYW